MNRPTAPRLFVDQALDTAQLRLDAEQAHYLVHVLRLRPGGSVVLFNGRGAEVLTTLTAATRRGASLESRQRLEPLPASTLNVLLLQGLAKADAMDWVVQKATELGVRALYPVVTEHSVVRFDHERSARRLTHWRRVSQSACEQCGRHTPLDIAPPLPLGERCASLPEADLKLVLDPQTTETLSPALQRPSSVLLLVGPEGGLSKEDLRIAADAGFSSLRLGPRVLRCDTAALAGCTLLQTKWGDLV